MVSPLMATVANNLGNQPQISRLTQRLEGGAVLTGRALRPGPGGTTPIQVGTTVLFLQLGQPLVPGTTVSLQSVEGQLLVQPQGEQTAQPDTPKQSPLPGQQSQGNAAGGLNANDTAQLLARALQLNQLPAKAATIQMLQTVLGQVSTEQAPLLAFLLARNIPITPDNLNAIRDRLKARGDLGRELGKMVSEIGLLLQTGEVRGSERLANLLNTIQALLSWDQEGSLGERMQQLQQFLRTLEEKLLGDQPASARQDFKALVMELEQALTWAEMEPFHPLRQAVTKVLQLLEGAQLSALTQTPQPDSNSWVLWRIPFPGDPLPTMVELAVRGERDPEQPERYHPHRLEVLLQVDLSVIGPVRIHLVSRPEQMRLVLTLSDVAYQGLAEEELPELKAALQSSGYPLVTTELQIADLVSGSLADEIDPLQPWENTLESPPPHLDLKI